MAILGGGDFTYEITGEEWGDLPDGWEYNDATAVAVDSKDNVYVFNRSAHPVIVYDRDGRFLRTWGEDIFCLRPRHSGRSRTTRSTAWTWATTLSAS